MALDNRHIIAGLADEVIPPGHVQQLEDVWQTGRVDWFQGSHLVFKDIPSINRKIGDLIASKLAPS